MDRRFLTWLMLTTALCLLYLSMRPQAPQNPPEPPASATIDPLASSESDIADTKDAEPGTSQVSESTKPEFASRRTTLGSMNPELKYNLLVTLSSRGASLERVELVEQKAPGKFRYRALETDSGYLGHLALDPELRITTVPDGSPAALARASGASGGLQIGDTLTQVNGMELTRPESLELALQKTKPGDEISCRIERQDDGGSQTLEFATVLTETPLDVLRTSPRIDEDIASNLHRPSLRTTLGSLGSAMIPVGQSSFPSLMPTLNEDWEIHTLEVEGGQGIEFRYPLDNLVDASRPNKLDLVKRYRLLPAGTSDGYLLDLETRVVNRNDEAVQLSLRQEGLAGMTLEGWWYSVKISPNFFAAAGQRDVTYRAVNPPGQQIKTTRQIFDHAKDTPNQRDLMLFGAGEAAESRQLSYIGLDSQYFNASILPYDSSSDSLTDLRRAAATSLVDIPAVEKSRIQAANTSFWFDSREQSIAPGSEFSQRYQIFIGPKESELLASHGLEQAIEYGWFPLVAKPLSAILHFFHAIVGNYGLAIVMLTVMVRGLMFPLGRKAAANAQKMQELQPELKRINDKYKDNMELRAKKMQELYAKHNFKPLAGCLPMFIQLPIFIGLYRCLSVDVSLRQEPLIPGLSWCSNLAGPDMLYNWSSWMPEFIAGKGTGWLGPYFNLLPILTVVLFIVQQKMLMPKATDEQTRMTQNMMQVMTVFMGVLFFKVPSGLCIYFITSSLWSLVERKLVKKTLPAAAAPTADTPAATTGDKKTPSSSNSRRKGNRDRTQEEKPSGRLQELMQMLEKPAVKSATQRGSSKRNPKKSRKQR